MRRNHRTPIFIFIFTVLCAVPSLAQDWVVKQDKAERGRLRLKQSGNATYEFIGSEFSFSNEIVKGAPYSASAITETTQVLGDGNRITRQTISRIFRDSEGRTRREQELPTIGNWVPEEMDHQLITISDPVAGISYSLNPGTLEAHKMSRARFNVVIRTSDGEGGSDEEGNDHKVVVMANSTATATFTSKERNVFVERIHEASPEAVAGKLERIQVAPISEGSDPRDRIARNAHS